MTPSNFIWRLARSLTTKEVEKFYYVSAVNNDGKQLAYVDFFRALRAQETYDEEVLREQFPIKNFSELKQRLEKRIIRALVYYRDTPAAQIDFKCMEIEILIEKGLYERAWKKLRVTKKEAQEIEAFAVLMRLLSLENVLLIKGPGKRKVAIEAEQLHNEHLEVLRKNTNQLEFQILFNRYYARIKTQFTPQGMLEVQMARQIQREPLLSSPRNAKSALARIYFLRLQYFAEYLIGNFKQGEKLAQRIVSTYEQNRHLITDNEDEYIFRVFDLMLLEFRRGQYQKGLRRLSVFEKKRNQHALHFEYYFTGLFGYCDVTKKHKKALIAIKEFEKSLHKIRPTSWKVNGNPFILYLSICRIYYSLGDYQQAVRWTKRIIDEQIKGERIDILGQTKLIQVILHYELGNLDLAESYIKSAAQFLNKRKSLFEFERLLLNLTRFLIRQNDRTPTLEKLKETKKLITAALAKDSNLRTFHFFNYQEWIDGKIRDLEDS